jgi:hypothetical protein
MIITNLAALFVTWMSIISFRQICQCDSILNRLKLFFVSITTWSDLKHSYLSMFFINLIENSPSSQLISLTFGQIAFQFFNIRSVGGVDSDVLNTSINTLLYFGRQSFIGFLRSFGENNCEHYAFLFKSSHFT